MKTHSLYVGIDVHRARHRAVFLPAEVLREGTHDWRGFRSLTLANCISDFIRLESTIRDHTQDPEEVGIAVDRTGHYSEPLVYFLSSRRYRVYYLEPKAVKAATNQLLDQENKDDTVDAAGFAYLLYLRDVHGLTFRISAIEPELYSRSALLRQAILQRRQYVKLVAQATNRLHQFLLVVFPEAEATQFLRLVRIASLYPTPKDMLASDGLRGVKRMSTDSKNALLKMAAETVGVSGTIYGELIKDLCRQREYAIAKREAIGEFIRKEIAVHPYGPILLSFPCFGPIAAAAIIGVVQDIRRWPNERKLKKALGVYGVSRESGMSGVSSWAGREGSAHGRRALFEVVFRCIRASAPDNDFRDYYRRQVVGGKPKMKAIAATMGKLAEIVYHCLDANEQYRYQGRS